MSSSRSLTPLDASRYDAIEDAVRETERGRWFLAEYARRNRNADTEVLLDAIGRLGSAVAAERGDEVGRFRGDLMEMADAIARTRAEVAALSAPEQGESRLTVASEALDAIVRATERATSDILGAAEQVQEAAWTLRETGADSELCDALDRHATGIYTACSFQDLTAQRTSRIVHTLRYLEDRIASMIGIWGAPEGGVPPLGAETAPVPADSLDQSDVDRFLDMENPTQPSPRAAPRSTLPPLPADALGDVVFLPVSASVAADEPTLFAESPADSEAVTDAPEDRNDEAGTQEANESADAFAPTGAQPAGAAMSEADPDQAREAAAVDEDDLAAAFPDLDRLSIEEKIALFA